MTTVAAADARSAIRDLATRRLHNFVDGEWREASAEETFDVLDPATGETLTTYTCSSAEDVDAAMRSARRAQPAWERTSAGERAAALYALADLCEENFDDLAALDALDAGKPITAAREDETPGVIDSLRFAAGALRTLSGPGSGPVMGDATSIFIREPFGVVAGITPWNYPLLQAAVKFAAAIAVGNTMVLKPAEITPLATARIIELAGQVLPPGVLNLVLGTGAVAGDALVRHRDADLLSFTGSVRVGRQIGAIAGERVRPSVLELGGNAPVLVFDDVDLEPAIEKIATAGLYNAGQECMAAARVLVDERRYDEFVAALAERAARQVLGDSLDAATQLGPLISAAQRDKVEGKVSGRGAGAEVVTGGSRAEGSGYFFEPTVIAGVSPDEELVAEETFGPVFTVQPFGEEAEAVAFANGTDYGLAASIWTTDVGRAMRVGSAVKAGSVWVNDHLKLAAEIPVSGFNMSGHGTENGEAGLLSATRLKHLAISHA